MAEPLKTSGNGAADGGADSGFASEKMQSPPRRLQRFDSLHTEAGMIPGGQSHAAKVGWATTLSLALQSLGVVYGDMGTSPLYVFSSTFTGGIKDTDDLLGVMSLIIYTVALLPLMKYCFIVLRANDNGDVLSAVGGIKESAKSLTQGQIAGIAITILIVLFAVQRFGTDKVGYTFGPVILTWFILIAGTEAMFADLGHFNVRAIQIGFSVVLLPSVLLAYMGQAAYLRIYPENVADTFYKSIPGIAVVFVMFITTLLVTLVMAMIWKTSLLWIALFPIIFGGAELMYLSSAFYKFKEGGYLPLGFAAILMLIMGTWHYVHVHRYKYELKNKVSNNYVAELATRRSLARLPGIGVLYSELVQGIPPILPHLVEKVPSIHSVLVIISIKYLPISNIETSERFLFRYVEPREYRVFRCVVRYGYNNKVEDPREFESLLIGNLKQFIHEESFFSQSSPSLGGEDNSIQELGNAMEPSVEVQDARLPKSSIDGIHAGPPNGCMDEIELIQRGMEDGVVHLLGETNVVAEQNAGLVKKIIVDYAYNFIRKNFRQPEKITCVPHNRLLRVGMTYEI
ncbi:hypothetical protein ACQ4PT_048852 [Festuca glaucescens]